MSFEKPAQAKNMSGEGVDWEKELENLGMPAEPISESQKAAQADIELISTEMMDPEAEIIARKLKEEDPRNILGGFPNSIKNIISLIKTLQQENTSSRDIKLYIHASCINGHDCVTLAHPDGKVYHYNTKNVHNYSRERMIDQLEVSRIPFVEK